MRYLTGDLRVIGVTGGWIVALRIHHNSLIRPREVVDVPPHRPRPHVRSVGSPYRGRANFALEPQLSSNHASMATTTTRYAIATFT
jgi:hypothetical protein